tara:strand:+ start:252 stop:623 length:372 start_codon:yes stop_codon:yes gene_type:complete
MPDNRPLSPHLSIHKPVLTALFSISHRITGIGLSLGSILLSLWFLIINLGPSYFFYFETISKSIFFKLILILWTIGVFYHLFNGFRKLYWSFGIGMDLSTVYKSGYAVLFLTFISTIVVWFVL